MCDPTYCSGTFVGQRVFDESIELNLREENELKLTLCFTPTKEYPSVFGGVYNESSSYSNIIHGNYDGITREAQFTEFQNGISIYKYECKLTVNKSNQINYLYGTWKSLIDSNLFGKLVMICVEDQPSESLSGIWIGESVPAEELADFYLPINPIRWCCTLFKQNNQTWKLFGSGYFNDSADIPDQPLLFFSLDGQGTLNHMNITKKYTTTDYFVEYTGKFIENNRGYFQFEGRWSNSIAGSYGSCVAKQRQLNSFIQYRLDICICEVCRNTIHPGENRWCCFQCHFSTCSSCNLNSIALNHPHKLILDILPNQNIAIGQTCSQLIQNAFTIFNKTPFIIYRSIQNHQFISMTYGQMSMKCLTLAKYWKQFVKDANNENRPIILFICDTSPAYICCLLTGILLQSVIYPINGSLNIDAIQHILKLTNPSIIVIGQQYLDKIAAILSSQQKQISMIIDQNEEQFHPTTNSHKEIISLTKALQFGEENEIDVNPSCHLSSKTMSAILSTSGSTGYPKGAIFTEELIVPNENFTLISPYIRIDYQPFDPVLFLSLMSTMKYGSSRGLTNLDQMWNDIQIIKPTSLGLTPSLWNFIYKNYLSKLKRHTTQIEKQQIEEQIREDLGGRLMVGTTGGGSISPTVFHFIRNKLKIDLVDIYGCRECGNISKNGFIYSGIDVKLIPIKDNQDEFDGIKQGEICIHSPKMIQGYWGIEYNTAFIEIEGKTYYKTGDIGQLEGNTIKLLDRSGTMIKNSMGEWISPVKIENIIEQLSEISLSFVMGHSEYPYLIAIICPSQSHLHLNEFDLLQLIRFHCVHCGLNGPEIPQKIFLETNLIWNQQNGLFKEKKSRHSLAKHYAQIKENIYLQTSIDQNQQLINQDFIEILEKILNRSLQGQINGDNTFMEIGGDSLSVSLLCQIYRHKGIEIDSSIIYNHSLDHLQHLLNNENIIYDQIIQDINWKDQSKLPNHFKYLIQNSKNQNTQHILLTGATGFLGPILLYEIIQKTDPSIIIYCLIRAKDDHHAKQRLIKDLEKCQRIHLIDWNRIKCIHGDVSKQYLGLNSDLFNQLIEQIGVIYHNASIVHLNMTYKSLKSANVIGTLNILEFVLRSNSILIYTSSTAALSDDPQSKEDSDGWISLTSNQINRKDGYGQTKVVVEQLLKQAKEDLHAKIIIIRPGTISADTLTGFSNTNDFINILLSTQIQFNTIVQDANINFHFVPVDYCAKVIVGLANNQHAQGKCFNLYGDSCSISIIYQALFNKFPHIIFKQIKQNQWKQFILDNLSTKSKYWTLKDQFASFQFIQNDQQGVNMKMTKDFLENQLNIQWFTLNQQYFTKSIDYLIEQQFFH